MPLCLPIHETVKCGFRTRDPFCLIAYEWGVKEIRSPPTVFFLNNRLTIKRQVVLENAPLQNEVLVQHPSGV